MLYILCSIFYNYQMKLDARQLRDLEEKKVMGPVRKIKRNPIYFILENIYDTYNIGGIFRLADAIAVEKIYLCGEMETPPNHRIKKASIGTYKVVPWEYMKSAREAILTLKNIVGVGHDLPEKRAIHESPLQIIAVEQHLKAIPYTEADYQMPVALIFGNETYGVTSETLKLADQIVEIPMWGINKSLNVIVSAAIVAYEAMKHILPQKP